MSAHRHRYTQIYTHIHRYMQIYTHLHRYTQIQQHWSVFTHPDHMAPSTHLQATLCSPTPFTYTYAYHLPLHLPLPTTNITSHSPCCLQALSAPGSSHTPAVLVPLVGAMLDVQHYCPRLLEAAADGALAGSSSDSSSSSGGAVGPHESVTLLLASALFQVPLPAFVDAAFEVSVCADYT